MGTLVGIGDAILALKFKEDGISLNGAFGGTEEGFKSPFEVGDVTVVTFREW